ncbi:MAG TPA: GntR family transcriptional regulator [Rugosimonospora sp.]|nr:GntR family transcriptional regulator [Rugosimonospora sp.]
MNPNSGHTVSRHFASLLRERILAGTLTPGVRIPGEAELAREYGLSPQTVRHALRALADEGMLVRREEALFVRDAELPVTVTLEPGDQVSARLPTLRESLAMGISTQAPLLVVHRASGATERYTGGTTRLAAGG